MKFNGSERKILETLFGMSQGYVLDFSNRTMEEFFQEHFGIEIYNPKYDRENLSSSKANRLRTIWENEDDLTVGKIIYALIEYMEISSVLNGKEISQTDLLLIPKVKDIATRLVSAPSPVSFQTETQAVLEKSKIVRDFTASQFSDFSLNKKIYLLSVLYSYYEAILRAYYGNGIIFLKSGIDELNVSFRVLRRKLVEVILSEPSFEELKESQCYQALIEPLTSLYSAPNFLDGVWSDGVEQYLIDFREIIADKDLFENNSEIHKFDASVASLMRIINIEIADLLGIMRKNEKSFFQRTSEINTEKSAKTKTSQKELSIKITSLPPLQIVREIHTRANQALAPRNITDLKVDMGAGDLEAFNDGSIRYKGTLIKMRGQLIALCRLFIGRPNRLVTIDDIREELIRADKRKSIPNKTLAKYVSELRAILMSHFKRDVFVNQKEDGWFFKP